MKCALLIIDMQKDFCGKDGKVYNERLPKVIPHIKSVLELFRKRKDPVIHVISVRRDDGSDTAFFQVGDSRLKLVCIDGTWGAEIVDELKPASKEWVVVKKRYSGFFETNLDSILRRLRVDTLIVTGVMTDACVRFTTADAYFRDYNVIIPNECTEADSEEHFSAAIENINELIGTTAPLKQVIQRLEESC